jgi:hypothetical protein
MLSDHEMALRWLRDDRLCVRSAAGNAVLTVGNVAGITAADCFQLFEQFGLSGSGIRVRQLVEVRQGPETLDWLLGRLGTGTERENGALLEAVASIDFPILRGRPDVLDDPRVDAKVRDHLRLRLELATVPVDQLYLRLMNWAKEIDGRHYGQFDRRVNERLVEALVAHGEPAAKLALQTLWNRAIKDWRELFAVEVLAEVRYPPATDELLNRLRQDDDVLPGEAAKALALEATPEMVARLESMTRGAREIGIRLSAVEALLHLPLASAEDAMLRLLKEADDVEFRSMLATSLMYRAPGPEAIEVIIDLYGNGNLGADGDPRYSLAPACVIAGIQPQELPDWINLTEAHEHQMARWIEEMSAPDAANLPRADQDPGDAELEDDLPPDFDRRPPSPDEITWPIRREAPKVGRNDPCPCGSGKKYKKCCLAGES